MKSVLFIINSIGYGGAERALVNLLSRPQYYLDCDIHVALLDAEPRARELPANITLHQLDSRRSLSRSIVNLQRLKIKIKPDLCVSFLVRANVSNAFLRIFSKKTKTILCERMHLSSHLDLQFTKIKRKISSALPLITYRFADAVIGVSSGVTSDLNDNFGVKKKNLILFSTLMI